MKIKDIIKRFRCNHEFEVVDSHMINTGMQKMITEKCKKCGKVKVEFV